MSDDRQTPPGHLTLVPALESVRRPVKRGTNSFLWRAWDYGLALILVLDGAVVVAGLIVMFLGTLNHVATGLIMIACSVAIYALVSFSRRQMNIVRGAS